ncbi:hypothetical protein NI443_004824 [Salmonella enterica]|nr:hypothetical protein [Salmonella enterica]HCJ1004098.1 hypothetical protein [Salmonella enterica]
MNNKIKIELCDEARNILTEKEEKIILSLLQGNRVTDIAMAACRDIRTISTQKKLLIKN